MSEFTSEIRDGMRIGWDVPIGMDDGAVLRADVYRPVPEGKYPVIMNHGPYAKWLHFEDAYPDQWRGMAAAHPDTVSGSTNLYQTWEAVDPEKWVPGGYACVRVDSRGAGRSPGYFQPWSPRETKDFHDCIEWAARQPWCNGKVGLSGISYYAMNQWQVAGLRPPHLAAMCAWEGAADFYRDMNFHGGIHSAMASIWYENSAKPRQHGKGERGYRSRINGEPVSGPGTLTEEELGRNRCDFPPECFAHPLDDDHWRARTPDLSRINVPLLSAGNWGGHGLHLRGNTEGFLGAGSKEKWLEIHGLEHWTHFYTDYGVGLQKKFFGHFLKGENTGWDRQPRVLLHVRHPGERYPPRAENEWPLARTKWTRFYLDPRNFSLGPEPPAAAGEASYLALGDGLTFLAPPLRAETEITGPSAARLFISSGTGDADLFLVLRVFAPDMREITFHGAVDPHSPIAHGWLRASHRKLDPRKSLPHRPWHTHDERQPLTPGEVYALDIEIWPTSVVVPAGCRVGLSVRGRDYRYGGQAASGTKNLPTQFTGVGPYKHENPEDRPADVFGGRVTLHAGPARAAYVMLPIIPAK
ncbi:MAG: CocE/NonD family hydrolase [Nitrospinota bacterium]